MPAFTQRLHDIGPVNRIPIGEGRVFQIGDLAVTVFRTRDNEVFATEPQCPHRAGPLADGLVGAGLVICPLHSYKFELATGQAIGNDCPNLRTYPAIVNGVGNVILRLES